MSFVRAFAIAGIPEDPPDLDPLMDTALSLTSLASIPQDVIRIISRLSFIHHDVLDLKSLSINPFVRFVQWWASWGLPGESNAGWC